VGGVTIRPSRRRISLQRELLSWSLFPLALGMGVGLALTLDGMGLGTASEACYVAAGLLLPPAAAAWFALHGETPQSSLRSGTSVAALPVAVTAVALLALGQGFGGIALLAALAAWFVVTRLSLVADVLERAGPWFPL
jgi:hypothetical protein